MNTKLMTGVAAIALVLPALVLVTTDANAARGGRGGGGHTVSHASAPARVSRPSVAHAAAGRPAASHVNVPHVQPSASIHTQAATRPLNVSQAGHPNILINRVGPNAHVTPGASQPMHPSTVGTSQPMHPS